MKKLVLFVLFSIVAKGQTTINIIGSTCSNPIVVSQLPFQVLSDNTANYGDNFDVLQGTLCGAVPVSTNYLTGNDVFYNYTAGATGTISITMTPIGASSANSSVFVYDGCDNVGVTCLGGMANPSTARRVVNLDVIAGHNYSIAISSSSPSKVSATQTIAYSLLIQTENCTPKPTVVSASNITLNSADLSWSNDSFTSWEVAVQPLGSAIPSGHGNSVSSNSYTATGLTSGTKYQCWVRAECTPSSGIFTAWAGPYAFNSLICNPSDTCAHTFRMTDSNNNGWNGAVMEVRQNGIMVTTIGSSFTSGGGPIDVTVPLCKDTPFELQWAAVGTAPQQCLVSVLNSFGQTIFTKAAGVGTAGTVIYSNTVDCTTPRCDIAPTNLSILPSTHSATLSWDATASNTWDIYIVPKGDLAPNVTSVPTYNSVTTNLFTTTIPILADTYYDCYVRVHCDMNSVWSAPVTFITVPTCLKPTALTATGMTTTAATLGWTNGTPTDTKWDVLLVPSTTTTTPSLLPTATPSYPGQILVSGINSPSPYTVDNLTPATIYFYYIRTVCSDTDTGAWAGPFVFNTATCDPANKCNYKFVLTDSGVNGWQDGRMQVRQNGIVVATLGLSITGAGPTIVNVALCPGIPFDLYWSLDGIAPNEIGVSIQSPFADVIYTKVPGDGTPFSVLFSSTGNCTPPTCPKPTSLTVSNLTQTTADLSWTESGTATQWEVYCALSGSAAPINGSPVTGVTPYYIANSNPFTITGLLPATSYTYYVRVICSSTDASTWTIVNPKTFTTLLANDECSGAMPVAVNSTKTIISSVDGTTIGATGSLTLPLVCSGDTDDDVWFSFVAIAPTHIITLSNIVGVAIALNHTVYSGSCGSLTRLYCSTAKVSVATNLIPGQTYTIRVYSKASGADQTATFTMSITTPPAVTNDECITAIPAPVNDVLVSNVSVLGSLAGATASTNTNTCVGTAHDDVWFSFTATATIHYLELRNVIGTTIDLNHAVYSGTCGALTPLYCSTSNSLVSTNTGFIVGQTYYVRVWSNSSLAQDVTFDLHIGIILPPITTNTTQYTTPQLVTDVLINNPCISVSNVTSSTGTNFNSVNGIGYFDGTSAGFPFKNGIILSSGNVLNAPGPNSFILNDGSDTWTGDVDLENIITLGTGQYMHSFNASKLEFDFTSLYEFMSFNFFFASEEYGFFQCDYADAFAFILTDLDTGITTNLAVVPGTSSPVSVITIRDKQYNSNCDSVNPAYFGNYFLPPGGIPSVGDPTNYNGMTLPMTASSATIPNHQYHIKLVVADRLDTNYDSAVFIEAGSFTSGPPQCSNQSKLVAFVDANNNGVKDAAEVNFTTGSFVIQENNTGAPTVVSASNGSYTLYDDTTTDTYDVSFQINPEYLANYTVGTTNYNDITIPPGSAMQTLYFPITVIQNFTDVSVAVIPESNPSPKPGTAFTNTIVYKNTGNVTASGTITFTNPNLATISNITQSGTVATGTGFTYDFTNLAPSETRTFNVTMDVASVPMANGGELLNSIASVSVSGNDTDMTNNMFTYAQVVSDINSSDGFKVIQSNPSTDYLVESHTEKIPYSSFGTNDYLTYTIRFQNTGTTNAINIRLEDVLDAKLDDTSIRMIGASHNYTMERVNNQLVWNLDYINLVGAIQDAELSKGFVSFKIKLKPGFTVGDIVPNKVSVYFDADTVIDTNTLNTEFMGALANATFTDKNIMLYPNPANNLVQITMQNTNENLKSISIHDVLGKTVKSINNLTASQTTVDVSNLAKGIYMVEIVSDSNLKLIKKLIVQ